MINALELCAYAGRKVAGDVIAEAGLSARQGGETAASPTNVHLDLR